MLIKEIDVKDIMTKSRLPASDYAVNPYVGCTHACKYCYANFMKRFTNHQENWGEFCDVKNWPVIRNPEKYQGKTVFFSSVTDPYNDLESKYFRTRAALEQLSKSGCRLSISTKSDLIVRDIDLIKTFKDPIVSWSINTLDESFRADMDNAVSIERRLAAMKIFYDEGIRTTCFISPIFPEITDVKAIISQVLNQCSFVWLENLNLRGSYKSVIFDYVTAKYPELTKLYKSIYTDKDRSYWQNLDTELCSYAANLGLNYVRNQNSTQHSITGRPTIVNYFYHEEIRK